MHLVFWHLLACGAFDYRLDAGSYIPSTSTPPEGELSFQVNFQWGDWGQSLAGCTFDLAFYEPYEDDGYGAGQVGQIVELPEEDGDCVTTVFDLDEERGEGATTVRGTLSAGDVITLSSPSATLELVASIDEQDRLYYRLEDCTVEGFPFGEVFDLDVPGSDEANSGGAGIPAFFAAEAIAVGPDLSLLTPGLESMDGNLLTHSAGEAFEAAWEYHQDIPEVDGETLGRDLTTFLANRITDTNELIETLACRPAQADGITLSVDDLATLSHNPADAETTHEIYQTSFQINTQYQGAEFETPWGALSRVGTAVSLTGVMDLRAAE